MAVFRIEKSSNFTVMANHHFKDKALSLKAKGLLSLALSLPDEWDYTLKGLTALSSDGIDSIRRTISELEAAGYILRSRERNRRGQLKGTEYVIYEQPVVAKPMLGKPTQGAPTLENPTQLNTILLNKNPENPYSSITHSVPPDMDSCREILRENIDYALLRTDNRIDAERLDELVELMAETICSTKEIIRIAGSELPHAVVNARFLEFNSEHIRFVFDCLSENTSRVKNIKQYLLTTLFNAPATIGNYYSALVNHDLYGGK